MSAANHVSRVRTLYKLIFRLHRALPAELRILGDNYAREEFKRHKNCNPQEANIFLNEWTDYAINLARQTKPLHQAKRKTVGKYLDPKMLDYMTDEQLVQLYELHKATSLKSNDSNQINISNKDSTER
ncbi:succinate dehydrogenase assembly factor 3, mitochondrial [Nymphalis io]|uniref:succinate dehydrogenase assembly factor 3, mitochondrial n=1 Tax=Inachis io TaxID=171585 RepID=UPI0021692D68|nr:succinate dehydrogenase assembly factor 3, mitochondrial [Nymphalis io]XP_050360837.1 succinate dehydrogenase assembly factor 3, mitochondrial [Nymphalis io]XP_050360838.1 succinate dehydrogenase assembly factor 3, mitochondrial [Nymphalis io]